MDFESIPLTARAQCLGTGAEMMGHLLICAGEIQVVPPHESQIPDPTHMAHNWLVGVCPVQGRAGRENQSSVASPET